MPAVKSVFEAEVAVPQARLAGLYADPANNVKWMHDLERCELLSGEPGQPGSTFRMVPRKGKMIFVATVTVRNLPHEAALSLDSPSVRVSVTGRFAALSPERTRFTSEEVFTFNGLLGGRRERSDKVRSGNSLPCSAWQGG